MSSARFQRHPSRGTAILFLGVAAVSVGALVWMGVRLIEQDRALEAQQLRERREAAADRLTAQLEQTLSAEEGRLADPASLHLLRSSDAVVITLSGISSPSDLRVWPDNDLLYYPVISAGREAPASLFAEAEKREFLDRDFSRAIRTLLPFSRSGDPAARAGAQLRLARNYRKAGDLESALKTYDGMAGSSDDGITVSGAPAGLAARRARCALLEELGRRAELKKSAHDLLGDLMSGRWRLDRASYLYYRDQAVQWLGQKPESDARQRALADAVAWLWENRPTIAGTGRDSAGRRSFRLEATSVTILWRLSGGRLAAVVAGPDYQRSRWFDPLLQSPDFRGARVTFSDPEGGVVFGDDLPAGGMVAARTASVTGLPWDIALVNVDREAVVSQFAQRRRLMTAGLVLLTFLVVAASYLMGRAVSRELAAARLQSDFVSAVSHEFRTPLTSMRQFTEMLVEDESLPPEKRRDYYGAQERATRRLSRLVESLLDFGRMEAGARPYRLERLDAGRFVRDTVEEFKLETGPADLALECAVPDQGPIVKADREALTQALWNLLDNAVKYSGDKALVRVEVEAGNEIAIRVRDKGAGILPSERKRIFRKFVRGSSATACGVKGTGIGLAMVKHIVDAHAGRLLVESEPKQGSTFTILLPRGE